MTPEETAWTQKEARLLFLALGREQARLFKALLEKAPLREISRAFDDMASTMGMILLAVLTKRHPLSSKKEEKEVGRILEMFNQAALAGRKVLLAAVRSLRK